MSQRRKDRNRQDDASEEVSKARNVKDVELAEETDDILDDIDEILEENAEEFIKGFVQKGGE